MGDSPWGHKELNMTERACISLNSSCRVLHVYNVYCFYYRYSEAHWILSDVKLLFLREEVFQSTDVIQTECEFQINYSF